MRKNTRKRWRKKQGADLKKNKTKPSGCGMWASLFAFFFSFLSACVFVCMRVCHPTHRVFFVVVGVRGRSKAMALQRNVVYTVTSWMGGWMDGCYWNYRSPWERAAAGAGRLSDHCFSCFCLFVSPFFMCKLTKDALVCMFFSSCTGEKEGLHQKPCRREDSPVLFCHFFPVLSFETPTFNPPPPLPFAPTRSPLWSNFNAFGTTQKSLFFTSCHHHS